MSCQVGFADAFPWLVMVQETEMLCCVLADGGAVSDIGARFALAASADWSELSTSGQRATRWKGRAETARNVATRISRDGMPAKRRKRQCGRVLSASGNDAANLEIAIRCGISV